MSIYLSISLRTKIHRHTTSSDAVKIICTNWGNNLMERERLFGETDFFFYATNGSVGIVNSDSHRDIAYNVIIFTNVS